MVSGFLLLDTVSSQPTAKRGFLFLITMYYTKISGMQIIHAEERQQYGFEKGGELFRYPNYLEVSKKPTRKEAEAIFSICKGGVLCARAGKTEKL